MQYIAINASIEKYAYDFQSNMRGSEHLVHKAKTDTVNPRA